MDSCLAVGTNSSSQCDENQEFQELLKTLPKEKGWAFDEAYLYQGFWIRAQILQQIILCQHQFQARHTDVLLATQPKSGTTWLKALAFAIAHRKRYALPTHALLTNNPQKLVPFIEVNQETHQQDLADRLSSLPPFSPRVLSTHLPYASLPESVTSITNDCRIVYLCRNPKDTLVSTWHFMSKIKSSEAAYEEPLSLEEAHELFCRGASPYGPFWEHMLGYWKASLERPEKVLFLRYEEMKKDIKSQVKRLAEHIGCPFTIEEENEGVVDDIIKLCSFENLKNLEVNKSEKMLVVDCKYFFRKGIVGDWVNYLTPQMAEQLDQVTKEKLQDHGFPILFKEATIDEPSESI
ncbi:hypothetical protein Sjap_003083 [Stephania japonica]|uniref:Sulfotransferase n=1 Tax=Stephania japonica TaxID=461633 RepID=A0AAP0PT64_9MAGN